MERSIRIGKDFNVRWSINKVVDGERQPYELAGKELVLQYRTPYGLKEATEWKTEGNTIVWTFRGKEQKALGSYGLILTENGGKDGMVTVDTCRAFKLVAHSCEETDGSGSDIVIEDVVLESEVAFAPIIKEGGEPYDDTELKKSIADLQAKDKATDVKLTELSEELASNGVLIEDLQNAKIDKEADDYYPQLSVGVADNLAGVDEVARVINFGQSGGGAITDGVARVQSIKGNSVVWNNLVKWRGVGNEAKGLTISYNNGLLHVSGTPTESVVAFYSALYDDVSITDLFANGHYYAICGKSNHANITIYGDVSITGNNVVARKTGDAMRLSIRVENMTIGESINESFPILVCDLTKMFGSGNEPTTIAEFYQRIPMGVDMNAYNEGEVINMKATGIKSVGRNAFDGNWEQGDISGTTGAEMANSSIIRTGYIAVIPNLSYYISTQGKTRQFIRTRLYDADKNFIGITSASGADIYTNEVFTIPSNAHYIRFAPSTSAIAQSDLLCLNISDTDFNGQYEPYIEVSEDLSIAHKYFPNGMRSAGSAYDEIRLNKATNKWEKVIRIGEVDMGTLAWDYVSASDSTYSMMTDALKTIAMVSSANNVVGNILCSKFILDSAEDVYNRKMPESIAIAPTGRITIFASGYTSRDSVAAFKAAMSGVMLYYELAEPIVTEIEEKDFNLDYEVWNFGTEQMVATYPSAPLAADITYGFNAVGLIKQLRAMIEALSAKVANL